MNVIQLPERTHSGVDSMTPREIVVELDKYVVGQKQAKRAVAIALRNRMRRQKLPPERWPAVAAHWSRPKCFVSMARHLADLRASASEIAATGSLGDLPLVVLTAASQPPAVREEHARIARLSSRGRHVVVGAGGHWIHLDQPEVVVRATRDVVGILANSADSLIR